jgi:ribosomal protein L30/L7E
MTAVHPEPKSPAPKSAPARKAKPAPRQVHGQKLLAIVRIRGPVRAGPAASRALSELGLFKKNWCALRPDTAATRNLLFMAKDYATWGTLDAAAQQALAKARGQQDIYTLNPPRNGHGRKGIKLPHSQRGALGDRGEAINNLLTRMI